MNYLSGNTHDRYHEAVATGLFVLVPAGAPAGRLAGCLAPFAWR